MDRPETGHRRILEAKERTLEDLSCSVEGTAVPGKLAGIGLVEPCGGIAGAALDLARSEGRSGHGGRVEVHESRNRESQALPFGDADYGDRNGGDRGERRASRASWEEGGGSLLRGDLDAGGTLGI